MSKFHVGDNVRFKTWEQMAAEFGVSKSPAVAIKCREHFTEPMRYLCGTTAKVKRVQEGTGRIWLSIDDLWIFTEDMLELVEGDAGRDSEQKVVITSDGKTTTAELFVSGKALRAGVASCSPSDSFDFGVGAKLALERLFFKPHLEWAIDGRNMDSGNIGDSAGCVDAVGQPLYVGDVVEVYYDGKLRANAMVVIASGVVGLVSFRKGNQATTGRWKVRKVKSFSEMKDGDVIHKIRYVFHAK